MSAALSLPVRLEKLHFLAEELQLAYALSLAAPDAWEGRLVARHILIRSKDFIEHARAAHRDIRAHGSTAAFNDQKETLARWFKEYYADVRDRLGAHVQDLDFGRRIELWKDIETSKVEVFVEGAAQIYRQIKGFGIPGYRELPDQIAELGNKDFQAALKDFTRSTKPARAEFAGDPLAMTRPGVVGAISLGSISERGGQLVLIARWVRHDLEAIERFAAFPAAVRIYRARLLTDVVSFADCLITRPVPADAPQSLTGLNDLLRTQGNRSQALDELVTNYRFEDALQRLRPLRDTFGAHLEVSPTTDFTSLIGAFDQFDWATVSATFKTLHGAFQQACRDDLSLRFHLIDGQTIRGAVPAPSPEVAAYNPAAPAPVFPTLPKSPQSLGTVDYIGLLNDWLGADAAAHVAAADMLRSAFNADVAPTGAVHNLSLGPVPIDITPAHQAVLDTLVGQPDLRPDLLQLLASQTNGYPNRAAETIVRFFEAAGPKAMTADLSQALGSLASYDRSRQTDLLRRAASPSRPWPVRRAAILGIFKSFVRTEGVRRMNSQKQVLDYGQEIEPWLVRLSALPELELRLAMSAAWQNELNMYRTRMDAECAANSDRLATLAKAMLARQGRNDQDPTVDRLLANGDSVGLVLVLQHGPKTAATAALLELVKDAFIGTAPHDGSYRNLRGCLWLAGELPRALEVAEHLAQRNPTNASDQIACLELRVQLKGGSAAVALELARLRADFSLTPSDEARLVAMEER